MRISFWQFLGLVVALVGLYYFYNLWWVDQDRNGWIDKFNGNVYNSADEMKDGELEPPPPDTSWP